MDSSSFNTVGQCPTPGDWSARKGQFRNFEAIAVGAGEFSSDNHGQMEPLIFELEHSYCAGSWISTILLAQAIIEISLAFHGYKSFSQREEFLKKYDLGEGAKKLRLRRNTLVHRGADDEIAVSLEQIIFNREDLRHEAKKAVSLALNIAFLGLQHGDAYST
jgi:hypothetical protein